MFVNVLPLIFVEKCVLADEMNVMVPVAPAIECPKFVKLLLLMLIAEVIVADPDGHVIPAIVPANRFERIAKVLLLMFCVNVP